jgi:hypothetical protein
MQKASEKVTGFRFQVSGLALLALVLAFACFGCVGEQARDASGERKVRGRQERVVRTLMIHGFRGAYPLARVAMWITTGSIAGCRPISSRKR